MARSTKKGAFVDGYLLARVEGMNARNEKKVLRTWSRRSTVIPGDGGTHDRGAQRQEVYSGVRDREHGGTQAGRVQLHAHVQGTLDEGGDGSGGEAGGYPGRSRSCGSGSACSAEGIRNRAISFRLLGVRS